MRNKRLPGMFFQDEIDQVQQAANAAGLTLTNYIRQQLRLPEIAAGNKADHGKYAGQFAKYRKKKPLPGAE